MKRAPGRQTGPVLTIITVCRNAEKTLQATLDSVLGQSYPNVQYVVIDGASTDGSLEILQRHSGRIDRIVSEPDRGIYDAMNKGLRYATGDLVGYIMADDQYLPGAFERVAEAWARADDVDIIAGATRMKNARTGSQSIGRPVFITSGRGAPFASVPHPSAFVARRAYDEYGGYDTSFSISSDADFFFRVAARGGRLLEIPDVLAEFNTGGISSRNELAPILEHFRVRRRYGSATRATADLLRNVVVHWLAPGMARVARSLGGRAR